MVSSSHFSVCSDSSSSSYANSLNQYEVGGNAELRFGDLPAAGQRFPDVPQLPDSTSRTGGLVSSSMSSFNEAESPSKSDGDDFSKPVLKYIDQVLMEESADERLSISHDLSALRATEKSLYDAIAADRILNATAAIISNNNRLPPPHHQGNYQPPFPSFYTQCDSWPNSRSSLISFTNYVDGDAVDEFPDDPSGNINDFVWQRGDVDGARKFRSQSIQLTVDTEERSRAEKLIIGANSKTMRVKKSLESSKGRKNCSWEDSLRYSKKERVNEQVSVSSQETELAELFDRILLCKEDGDKLPLPSGDGNGSEPLAQCCVCSEKNRVIPPKKRDKKDRNPVDLRHLLIVCAEAISSDDYRKANDLLVQISQHATPMGDGVQRLAYYFAKGLEARLSGSVAQKPNAHVLSMKVTIADMLRYYQTMFRGCPFIKIMISFANNMIAKVAEQAKTLHVVDFGILHGFQWPLLIQLLSRRPGGPPKLRITGIEMPQQGPRPWARIEETGIVLSKCCERMGVPFEYHGIASNKWETIKISELKLDRNEVLAVNCFMRFKYLLDETVTVNSPRDAVLQLIREMKPDVFVQSIVNGSYNSPFFLARFREVLYHFSVLYDMMDANLSRHSIERVFVEGEFYGWQAMNVIASEGAQRLERPETYKQWQNRIGKARFGQLEMDPKLLEIYQTKLKEDFNGDFLVYEDSKWLLQGYKGRIIYASSAWKPV